VTSWITASYEPMVFMPSQPSGPIWTATPTRTTLLTLSHKRILLTCDRDYLDERRLPLIHSPVIVVCNFGAVGSNASWASTIRDEAEAAEIAINGEN